MVFSVRMSVCPSSSHHTRESRVNQRWAEVRQTPKFGRMFGSATCDYSAKLRQKLSFICVFAFVAFCACRWRCYKYLNIIYANEYRTFGQTFNRLL